MIVEWRANKRDSLGDAYYGVAHAFRAHVPTALCGAYPHPRDEVVIRAEWRNRCWVCTNARRGPMND